MKLLLQSNGGFSGFYSKFILIDTDLHKMVKTDGLMKDGLTGIKYIWDYSNIGQCKIRELLQDRNCPFIMFVGKKQLVKRKAFERYIEQTYSI